MSRIVLANAVGVDSDGYYMVHSPSRWSVGWKDYREVFTYYPWELCYATALLKRDTDHQVVFVDGCLEKLDCAAYCTRIVALRPDYLVLESSSRTYREDLKLALMIKARLGTKLIFCGQHASAFPELVAESADFVLLGEYEETLLELFSSTTPAQVLGVWPNARRQLVDIERLPFPEDDDVSRYAYAVPGEPNCEYREIQAYASRGCPVLCNFCVCSNLYYGRPNYRTRPVAVVIAELKYLRAKYPEMEGIFFDEEVHNVRKSHSLELCEAICQAGLADLKYNAMCAYYTLDRELLEAYHRAGYYKLRIGIETADPQAAAGIGLGRKFNIEKLYQVLTAAREVGIAIYGTFTVGAWGSSAAGDQKTAQLVQDLVSEGLLRDLQASICTPQPGTPFFKLCQDAGYLLTEEWQHYDGGAGAVVNYPDYSAAEIEAAFTGLLAAYDRGLMVRRRAEYAENFKIPTVLAATDRVLVLRTNRMWQMQLCYDYLHAEYPQAQLDVLCQEVVAAEIAAWEGVTSVYSYGAGFVNLDSLGPERLAELEAVGYKLVIVLYNNFHDTGYTAANQVAAKIGAEQLLALYPDGRTSTISLLVQLKAEMANKDGQER